MTSHGVCDRCNVVFSAESPALECAACAPRPERQFAAATLSLEAYAQALGPGWVDGVRDSVGGME